MSKQQFALKRSRLGLRMIGMILLSVALAVGVGFGVNALGNAAVNSATFNTLFEDDAIEQMLKTFQEYVDLNNIHSTDYLQVKIWMTKNTGVSFLYDAAAGDEGEYSIRFADKTVGVIPYLTNTKYSGVILLASFIVAALCFLLVLLPFVRRVISDIKRLSHDMEALTGGDLQHPVSLRRRDELGELAKDIDDMRRSVIYRMAREAEAVKANQDLITALSHDLRTPLTKQMGYLELAIQGKCGDEAALKDCLEKAYRASGQLQSLSNELFSYFLAFGGGEQRQLMLEEVDGQLLVAQLLEEQSAYLRGQGFTVENQPVEKPFSLRLNLPWLARIVDNMTSNIIKYADAAEPVRLYCVLNRERVFVHFENAVRMDVERREGTNIGVRSARKLAQDMGGDLCTESAGARYFAILELPASTGQN